MSLSNNSTILNNILTKVNNLPSISDSSQLNFKVVGGTTEPSNRTENMIWVNTSTTISGWVFSPTEPTSPSPNSVWISVGSSNDVGFNAITNNGIELYPVAAKQYIGGTWVDKVAKSWQNNAWVDWVVKKYLYESGTGAHLTFYVSTNTNSGIDVRTDKIVTTFSGSSKISSNIRFSAFDFTKARYLYFDYICIENVAANPCYVGLLNGYHTDTTFPSSYVCRQKLEVTSERKTICIPLTAVSGEKYLHVVGAAKYEIYNIYVEE